VLFDVFLCFNFFDHLAWSRSWILRSGGAWYVARNGGGGEDQSVGDR
jgi:hypothetical protein